MSSENSLHIRLDYVEALEAEKTLLSSELSLNIAKKIARYKILRLEEFKLKSRLYRKMKETKSSIKNLQEMLPNPKIPKILKKSVLTEKSPKETKESQEGDIEFQLRQIQRRLEELQQGN